MWYFLLNQCKCKWADSRYHSSRWRSNSSHIFLDLRIAATHGAGTRTKGTTDKGEISADTGLMVRLQRKINAEKENGGNPLPTSRVILTIPWPFPLTPPVSQSLSVQWKVVGSAGDSSWQLLNALTEKWNKFNPPKYPSNQPSRQEKRLTFNVSATSDTLTFVRIISFVSYAFFLCVSCLEMYRVVVEL